MSRRQDRQAGVTSIFVVIFATILLSVITLSFAGLMAREQRRSSDDELSQSAYDSALAGVEDAKRVVLTALGGDLAANAAIDADECTTIQDAFGITGSDDEVVIQSNTASDGAQLNQAYTCVKIALDSPNYELTLADAMQSEIVPLRAVSDFDRLRIEWHQPQPVGGEVLRGSCSSTLVGADAADLCPSNQWTDNNPTNANLYAALLRAQIITPGSSIDLDSLDESAAGNTTFLYPTAAGGGFDLTPLDRFVDGNGTTSGSTHQARAVECDVALTDYLCSIEIQVGTIIPAESRNALLRLTSIYRPTDVQVTLLNGADEVMFDGVQPVVDSTGRANDLFRRVEARLSLTTDVVYPEAALDVNGPICKDFVVTNSGAAPLASPACSP